MVTGRSFAELVKDKCYNSLHQAAKEYVNKNRESRNIYTENVHRIGRKFWMKNLQKSLTACAIDIKVF